MSKLSRRRWRIPRSPFYLRMRYRPAGIIGAIETKAGCVLHETMASRMITEIKGLACQWVWRTLLAVPASAASASSALITDGRIDGQ